jgi:phosphoglycolate phosphatase
MHDVSCNICGGTEFQDMRGRGAVLCSTCGSLERTRVLKLMLDEYRLVQPGFRVLHFAPELALAKHIKGIVLDGYETYDLNPFTRDGIEVKKFDLVTDVAGLQSRTYDLVIHSHVVEHLPCDVTAVLFHLHRSLKDSGAHVMCIPFGGGRYQANFADIPDEERIAKFGQTDHFHKFGQVDAPNTVGMVFNLPQQYDLDREFGAPKLDAFNIPPVVRRGITSSSILVMRKGDLLLRDG